MSDPKRDQMPEGTRELLEHLAALPEDPAKAPVVSGGQTAGLFQQRSTPYQTERPRPADSVFYKRD